VCAKLLGKIGFEYLSGAMFSTTVRTKGKSLYQRVGTYTHFSKKIEGDSVDLQY
jgi:hypothetical protein